MPKLIRSHALDALDERALHNPKTTSGAAPGDRAKRFVAKVARAAQGGGKMFPTVGLGDAMRVDGKSLAAAALLVDGAVVHLAAFDMGQA